MRGTIDELGQLLDDLDPRWYAFGLVPPGLSDQPDQPADLVLTAGAPGSVLADWSDAARAVSYRVYKQVVGTDPDFILAVTVSDSDATLTGLPSAATVKIRVVAVNADGDVSPPSETKQIVVP
jgi:hypothetical protein